MNVYGCLNHLNRNHKPCFSIHNRQGTGLIIRLQVVVKIDHALKIIICSLGIPKPSCSSQINSWVIQSTPKVLDQNKGEYAMYGFIKYFTPFGIATSSFLSYVAFLEKTQQSNN